MSTRRIHELTTPTAVASVNPDPLRVELGVRASRALAMENHGPARRRLWWIVSSAVVSTCEAAPLQAA